MPWKKNSIIWFDDPSLLQSLEINNPEDVVKIKDIFQWFKQVNDSTNQVLKKILSFSEMSWDIVQEYWNTSMQWWDVEQENNDFFNTTDECNFTNSIINNHSQLLYTQNDYKKTEIMDSIIQEILITVHMFSEKRGSNFGLTMLEYIKYIINIIIIELRKDPYLHIDEDESEEELTNMSDYFSDVWKSINEMIYTINKDKDKEDKMVWKDGDSENLKIIHERRQWYCEKRSQIKKYYDMRITQYIIILQSIILYWNWYLPGLYQKLCDVIDMKLALDVIDEYDDSQQE